jgi:hypothetical protein
MKFSETKESMMRPYGRDVLLGGGKLWQGCQTGGGVDGAEPLEIRETQVREVA